MSLPTADELSQPGALQSYLNRQLEDEAEVLLPMGTIRLAEPLVIPRTNGGRIAGVGMPTNASTSSSGWNLPSRYRATRLVYEGPPEAPAIRWEPCQGMTIERLGIEAQGGIGMHWAHVEGWGGALNRLSLVSFLECEVGFQAGLSPADHNAADLTFADCLFKRCERGFVCKHDQGVNYVFIHPTWDYCHTCLDFERGGNASIFHAVTYNDQVFIRAGQGGPNVSPFLLQGARFDAGGSEPWPIVLLDAESSSSSVRLVASGICITGDRGRRVPLVKKSAANPHATQVLITDVQTGTDYVELSPAYQGGL